LSDPTPAPTAQGHASPRTRLLTAAPIVSALLVVVFGLLVRLSTAREDMSARLVEHTHQVIETNEGILARLLDAETGERGFLITGEPSYLEPFQSAADDVATDLRTLRALIADNPQQLRRLGTLDGLSRRLVDLLGERIRERRDVGLDSVRVSVASGEAKILMDSIRSVASDIESNERILLDERERDQARFHRVATWVVVLGMLLAGSLAGAIAVALARHAAAQGRLARRLDEQNAVLEDQKARLKSQADELVARAEALELTQRQLVERTQEAESASRAKSEFLARMSHELRTPLNAIGGYVELIELGVRGPVTDEQRSDLARVKQSSAHLLWLINDLLHFSQLEAGRVEFNVTPVDPGDVLAEVEPMIAPQANARGLDLVVEPPPPGVLMVADRPRCRQILINLLANACKFTPAEGRITVCCDVDADRVRIHVADTGPGIPAESVDEIFDPFVQVLGDAQERGQRGIGLGLPISRDLARGMGGDLTVVSEPGVGSTFTLTLPRDGAPPAE
jgi:signal transduction histidine kinase